MHEVLVNRLGGLNLPRKSVVRLIDRPDMTLGVYRGRKSTIQQQQKIRKQPKFQIMILQVSHFVQYDARAERANSTCTCSVASQAFNLVILLDHIIAP